MDYSNDSFLKSLPSDVSMDGLDVPSSLDLESIIVNISENESPVKSKHITGTGTTIGSVPDRGHGVRDMFFDDDQSPVKAKHAGTGTTIGSVPDRGHGIREYEDGQSPVKANRHGTGTDIGSVPDRGYGVRDMFFEEDKSPVKSKHAGNTGTTIGSVPDRGHGVRESFNEECQRAPVDEDIIAPSKAYQCGKESKVVEKKKKLVSRRKRSGAEPVAKEGGDYDNNGNRPRIQFDFNEIDGDGGSSPEIDKSAKMLEFLDVKGAQLMRDLQETTSATQMSPLKGSAQGEFFGMDKNLMQTLMQDVQLDRPASGSDNLKDPNKRIQEEVSKRLHCEKLIRALQAELLSAQEHSAVMNGNVIELEGRLSHSSTLSKQLGHIYQTTEKCYRDLTKENAKRKVVLKELKREKSLLENDLSASRHQSELLKERLENVERESKQERSRLQEIVEMERQRIALMSADFENVKALRKQEQVEKGKVDEEMEKIRDQLNMAQGDLMLESKQTNELFVCSEQLKKTINMLEARERKRGEREAALTADNNRISLEAHQAMEETETLRQELKRFESRTKEVLEKKVREYKKEKDMELDKIKSATECDYKKKLQDKVSEMEKKFVEHIKKIRDELAKDSEKNERALQLTLRAQASDIKILTSQIKQHEKEKKSMTAKMASFFECQREELMTLVSQKPAPSSENMRPPNQNLADYIVQYLSRAEFPDLPTHDDTDTDRPPKRRTKSSRRGMERTRSQSVGKPIQPTLRNRNPKSSESLTGVSSHGSLAKLIRGATLEKPAWK